MSAQGSSHSFSQVAARKLDTVENVKGDMLSYSANDDKFKKLRKIYENSNCYADQAVEGFRATLKIGQHPMALSKLSEEDKAMLRSHSDAWSDIRQSM